MFLLQILLETGSRLSLVSFTGNQLILNGDNGLEIRGNGADIKLLQQNDFTPNIRTGMGIEYGNKQATHVGFILEYYNGHLPYSVMEYNKVNWFGASIILLRPRLNQDFQNN